MVHRKFVLTHIDKAVKTADHLRTLIELAKIKGDDIILDLFSLEGGDTDVGLEVIDVINNSPVHITGVVHQKACSMAAIILQACHKRKMHKGAFLDYHYANWRVSLLTYFDHELMARNVEAGVKLQHALFGPVMKSTGMSQEQVHALFRIAQLVYAEKALELNLTDEII